MSKMNKEQYKLNPEIYESTYFYADNGSFVQLRKR